MTQSPTGARTALRPESPEGDEGAPMHEIHVDPIPMVSTPDTRLVETLEDLGRQARGVHAIVIGDRNGLPIASSMRGRQEKPYSAGFADLIVSYK